MILTLFYLGNLNRFEDLLWEEEHVVLCSDLDLPPRLVADVVVISCREGQIHESKDSECFDVIVESKDEILTDKVGETATRDKHVLG